MRRSQALINSLSVVFKGWSKMARCKAPEQMALFAAFIRFAGRPGKERTKHGCASWRDAPPVIQPFSLSLKP